MLWLKFEGFANYCQYLFICLFVICLYVDWVAAYTQGFFVWIPVKTNIISMNKIYI